MNKYTQGEDFAIDFIKVSNLGTEGLLIYKC